MKIETPTLESLQHIIRGKFLLLLLALIALILISPYFLTSMFGKWVMSILSYAVLISVIFAIRHQTGQLIFFVCIATGTLIVDSLYLLYGYPAFLFIDTMLSSIFYGAIILIIISSVLSTKTITQDTIYGAICAYMLMAVAYGQVYTMIEIVSPQSFFIDTSLSTASTESMRYYLLYFSFTTLSTVGFGEIVPISLPAISVVILEQITGVLYLAVLVARLVAGLVMKD